MASPSLVLASLVTLPWMGAIQHPTHPTMALRQLISLGLHHKVKCSLLKNVRMSETSSSSGRLYFKHSEGYNLGVSYMPPAM